MPKDVRFWIRLKGSATEAGIMTVQFRIDGDLAATDLDAVPAALRLHNIGYSASDDYAMRLDLLEQSVLAGASV